jgi:hypothetical protein
VVDLDTAEDFDRARAVASRKAGRALTRGELIKVLSADYLAHCDPDAAEPRERRMPQTSTRPRDRGVPAEVSRAIGQRSGGLCEFGGCTRPAEQLCHLTPHANGSGREVTDLVDGCKGHLRAYDAGLIRWAGWTNDRLPTFLVDRTNELMRPKSKPAPLRWEAWPDWVCKALSEGAKRKLARWRKRAAGGSGPTGGPPTDPDPTGAGLVRDRSVDSYRAGGLERAPPPRRRR